MKKDSLKVSVVMPVYNAERYLHDSINSVLNQTLDDFELIIVDDGSVDNSRKIINEFTDKRIVLVENNHNFIESLNIGMKLARAPFIARMDADDIMLNKRLEVQYEYMKAHPEINVCGSWFVKFDEHTEQLCRLETDPEILKVLLLTQNPLAHPTTMICKRALEFLLKLNPDGPYRKDYLYAEDYKLWCEIVEHGGVVLNLPEILLKYRRSDCQVVRRFRREMIATSRKIQNEYFTYVINDIAKKHPESLNLCKALVELANSKSLSFESLLDITSTLCYNYG